MSTHFEPNSADLERLSALVDGELDRNAVAQACGQWRHSAPMRASWHAYHLIGDVLRSDDLACDPACDARFLATLRERLHDEPVVLAPQPLEFAASPPEIDDRRRATRLSTGGRWSAWAVPSAAAAAFIAVAGILLVTRLPGDGAPAGSLAGVNPAHQVAPVAPPPVDVRLAAAPGPTSVSEPTSTAAAPETPAAEPQPLIASGQLIRDARLDRYLAAHKQFAGSSALGTPSAYFRNATAAEPER